MRYWIWWNDLIQGPFELDELTSLRAFSEELLVCMEDREDWLPAGRVADLSSAVEQLRVRKAAPLTPPPPPPRRPPATEPLQGEFFSEPQGQQSLLKSEDEPKGPFAYRSVASETLPPGVNFDARATMPFHFSHQPETAVAVIELLRRDPPKVAFTPQPVIKESPVRKEELAPPPPQKIDRKPPVSFELLREEPSLAPAMDEPYQEERKLEWLPWILGVILALSALGTTGYWILDKASTHSAIAEANRLEPPRPLSISVSVPVRPSVAIVQNVTPKKRPAFEMTFLRSVLLNPVHAALRSLEKTGAALTGMLSAFHSHKAAATSAKAQGTVSSAAQNSQANGSQAAASGVPQMVSASASATPSGENNAQSSPEAAASSAAQNPGENSRAAGHAASPVTSVFARASEFVQSTFPGIGRALGLHPIVSENQTASGTTGSTTPSGENNAQSSPEGASSAVQNSGENGRTTANAASPRTSVFSRASEFVQSAFPGVAKALGLHPLVSESQPTGGTMESDANSQSGGGNANSPSHSGASAVQSAQESTSAAEQTFGKNRPSSAIAAPQATSIFARAAELMRSTFPGVAKTLMSSQKADSNSEPGGGNADSVSSLGMGSAKSAAASAAQNSQSSVSATVQSSGENRAPKTNAASPATSLFAHAAEIIRSLFPGVASALGLQAAVGTGTAAQAASGTEAAASAADSAASLLVPTMHAASSPTSIPGSVPEKVLKFTQTKAKKTAAQKKSSLRHGSAEKKSAAHASMASGTGAQTHKPNSAHSKTPPDSDSLTSASSESSGAAPAAESVSASPSAPVSASVPAPVTVAARVPAAVPADASAAASAAHSKAASLPGLEKTPPAPAPAAAPDLWAGRQSEAINLVIAKKLPNSKVTVGSQARTMLQEMHEKELLHAADTGERLYLPDKIAWAALHEEGSVYRVYLNFLAWQASGERVQARSYQFIVDLTLKSVKPDDAATLQDMMTQPAELSFKHNPMATDIDSILGGVDTYNKHKVQLIIVKKNNRNREDRKKIEAALNTAEAKVGRGIYYFRRTYTEKALQNIAKAYNFQELVK